MSYLEHITTSDAWLSPLQPLPPLPPRMEELLHETVQQTGRGREEILHLCLKHGIERMLENLEKGDIP
jgi:hypothetical protein